MKKLLALLLFSLMSGISTLAQVSKIQLNYKENDNLEIKGLLNVLNAHQITVIIPTVENDNHIYELWLVKSSKGNEEKQLFGFMPIAPDSTEICITTMAIDSLNVRVSISPIVSANRTLQMSTANCILMECAGSNNDTIPVIAYTPGAKARYQISEGQYVDALNYCAIRDCGLHPSIWYEKFNIEEYFFIEAIPVKEVDFTKAMPQ